MSLGRLLAGDKQAERGRRLRRSFPVHVYTGRNGSSKSLLAVWDTLPDLDAGLPVLSTVRLTDFRNPRPCDDEGCSDPWHGKPGHLAAHPSWIEFKDWPQLVGFTHGVVLMDEITGIADSTSASLPTAISNLFAQMRRGDFSVRITTLNFIRAHKRLREAANAVTRCTSFLPVTVQDEEGRERIWRQRRLSVARTYDAQSLPIDDPSEAAYEKADLMVKSRLWIPGSPVTSAYDTFAPVSTVGAMDESGLCYVCYGTKRRAECSCPDYLHDKAQRREAGRAQPRSGEHGKPGAALSVVGASGSECSGGRS